MTSSGSKKYVRKVKDEEKVDTKVKSSCPICTKKFRNVLLHIDKKNNCKAKMSEKDYNQLTLSGPTSGDFSQIQSKIHASDKYILRFISVRSMSGPERVKIFTVLKFVPKPKKLVQSIC